MTSRYHNWMLRGYVRIKSGSTVVLAPMSKSKSQTERKQLEIKRTFCHALHSPLHTVCPTSHRLLADGAAVAEAQAEL